MNNSKYPTVGQLSNLKSGLSRLDYWQIKYIALLVRAYILRKAITQKSYVLFRTALDSRVPTARSVPTVRQLYTLSNEQEHIELISDVLRTIKRRRRRAVIVSAVYRVGMYAGGVCDLLSASGIPVIYSMLYLLIVHSAT